MKITTTTTKTIEIKLPYFAAHEKGIFAILTENKCVKLTAWSMSLGWTIDTDYNPERAFCEPHTEITADEFKQGYDRIVSAIHDDMEANIASINQMLDADIIDKRGCEHSAKMEQEC